MAEELTTRDLTAIRELYGTRFRELGESVETLGWGSRESQTLRFQQLFRGLDPRGKRILDFGCGFADLIPYLDRQCDAQFDYVGVDLCPELLDVASDRYSSRGFRFVTGDLLRFPNEKIGELDCDIAVASGAFSFKIEKNFDFVIAILRRLCDIASEVVCLNFLSIHVDYQLEKNFHYCPATMLQHALMNSRRVALYHDYPLWEFTLHVYRDRWQAESECAEMTREATSVHSG